MHWMQSSSIPIQSFGFIPVGSQAGQGGAFWMYNHFPDEMLLCTHVNDFLLSANNVSLARRFYAHYSLSHACKFVIAGTFVGLDILRDREARKMYLSQVVLIDHLLEQEFNGNSYVLVLPHWTTRCLSYPLMTLLQFLILL
jgi:hypothetical protein